MAAELVEVAVEIQQPIVEPTASSSPQSATITPTEATQSFAHVSCPEQPLSTLATPSSTGSGFTHCDGSTGESLMNNVLCGTGNCETDKSPIDSRKLTDGMTASLHQIAIVKSPSTVPLKRIAVLANSTILAASLFLLPTS